MMMTTMTMTMKLTKLRKRRKMRPMRMVIIYSKLSRLVVKSLNSTTDDAEENDDDDTEAPADADYGGFSLAGLLDELDDDDDEKPAAPAAVTTPANSAPTSRIADHKDNAQGKEDNGAAASEGHVESAGDEATLTPAPAVADATTVKSTKKSKKARKQKKKKTAAAGENDFALEVLNGILDFFN